MGLPVGRVHEQPDQQAGGVDGGSRPVGGDRGQDDVPGRGGADESGDVGGAAGAPAVPLLGGVRRAPSVDVEREVVVAGRDQHRPPHRRPFGQGRPGPEPPGALGRVVRGGVR